MEALHAAVFSLEDLTLEELGELKAGMEREEDSSAQQLAEAAARLGLGLGSGGGECPLDNGSMNEWCGDG